MAPDRVGRGEGAHVARWVRHYRSVWCALASKPQLAAAHSSCSAMDADPSHAAATHLLRLRIRLLQHAGPAGSKIQLLLGGSRRGLCLRHLRLERRNALLLAGGQVGVTPSGRQRGLQLALLRLQRLALLRRGSGRGGGPNRGLAGSTFQTGWEIPSRRAGCGATTKQDESQHHTGPASPAHPPTCTAAAYACSSVAPRLCAMRSCSVAAAASRWAAASSAARLATCSCCAAAARASARESCRSASSRRCLACSCLASCEREKGSAGRLVVSTLQRRSSISHASTCGTAPDRTGRSWHSPPQLQGSCAPVRLLHWCPETTCSLVHNKHSLSKHCAPPQLRSSCALVQRCGSALPPWRCELRRPRAAPPPAAGRATRAGRGGLRQAHVTAWLAQAANGNLQSVLPACERNACCLAECSNPASAPGRTWGARARAACSWLARAAASSWAAARAPCSWRCCACRASASCEGGQGSQQGLG